MHKHPKFTDSDRFRVPYVPSGATDISKTIKREIARLKAEKEAQERDAVEAQKKVSRIRRQA